MPRPGPGRAHADAGRSHSSRSVALLMLWGAAGGDHRVAMFLARTGAVVIGEIVAGEGDPTALARRRERHVKAGAQRIIRTRERMNPARLPLRSPSSHAQLISWSAGSRWRYHGQVHHARFRVGSRLGLLHACARFQECQAVTAVLGVTLGPLPVNDRQVLRDQDLDRESIQSLPAAVPAV